MNKNTAESGSTVISALLIAPVLAVLVGAAVHFTSHNSRNAVRQREVDISIASAEGILEYNYSVWKQIIREKGLRAPSTKQLQDDSRLKNIAKSSTIPDIWLAGTGNKFSSFSLKVTDEWGVPAGDSGGLLGFLNDGDVPPAVSMAVPNFPGWRGDTYFYRAQIQATGSTTLGNNTQLQVGLNRYFQMTQVPLFQTMAFFEGDLEIHPGAPMILTGLLHTNKDMYAAGYSVLQFKDNVSYVGKFSETAPDTGDWTGSGSNSKPKVAPYWADGEQGDNSTAKASQLKQTDRMEPFGTEPWRIFNTSDSNPNNDGFHELIEPPVSGKSDPVEIAERCLFNKASLRVTGRIPKADPVQRRASEARERGGKFVWNQRLDRLRFAVQLSIRSGRANDQTHYIKIDEKNQVRLVVSARQLAFAQVDAGARRFMSSWFELTPELEFALRNGIR